MFSILKYYGYHLSIIFLSINMLKCTDLKNVESESTTKERPPYCGTPVAELLNPECGKISTTPSSSSSGTTGVYTSSTSQSITPPMTTKPTTPANIPTTTAMVPQDVIDNSGPPFINYFGVAFSPYVLKNAPFNSYSMEDIKRMLNILLTNHNSISTYGMGVESYNKDNPWDQTDSPCLIARAAATINKDRRSYMLSIYQGINQHQDSQELQDREIENAFSAAVEANQIFSGTVARLIFTTDYIDQCEDCGSRILNMIKTHKMRASEMEIRVGTRIHICDQINGGPYQEILTEIVRESHFIMCNLYPEANSSNVDRAIIGIGNEYFKIADGIWDVNSHIEVMIGETGWASEGQTYNAPQFNTIEKEAEFWRKMKNWAAKNRVRVQMFEGFDEPWKENLDGLRKLGWWYREANGTKYIEKSTGKEF